MCWFELISPGSTVIPAASITSAPCGTATVSIGPISTMRSPRITTVWSCRGGAPVASISSPPTIAIGLSARYGGACGPQACRSTASHAKSARAITRVGAKSEYLGICTSSQAVRRNKLFESRGLGRNRTFVDAIAHDAPVGDNEAHPFQVFDVLQRIGVDDEHIGEPARLERSELVGDG